MKKIIFLFTMPFLLISLPCSANVYYISESTGSDGNSGLSHAAAWRELDQIEDFSFSSGDRVLLLCGDTWNRDQGDWGSGETEIAIGNISGFTIGAYYMDSGTPREVDGSTYTCPGDNPTVDGNVLSHSGGMTSPHPSAFRFVANTDNVAIKDIKVQNYNAGFSARQRDATPGPITNGTFERLETYNTGRYGVNLSSNPKGADNVSDWTVANCKIIHSYMAFEDEPDATDGWGISLMLKHVDNYRVYNNIVGQGFGEGIGGWGGADNGEIYNNLVYETASVSIYLSCCHNVDVHHNYVVGTANSRWHQGNGRTRGGIGFGSETDCEPAGTCSYRNNVDSSGCTYRNNVVIGRRGGFSLTNGQKDDDSGSDPNYVYNNLFIDNENNYKLWDGGIAEMTIYFQNNLSVVNDTANSNHIANPNPTSDYIWLGNGWDNSEAVDSDYTHANDVVGDPAIVNPTPCVNGWYQCTAHDIPSWGDAAFTASSDFLDNAQALADTYRFGLGPSSTWPGAVVIRDQNSNGSGWEFGAYVYPGTLNAAPVVDAGTDQSITLPSGATLDGTVTDDGLPDPPASVTVRWTKVSGPGTVTFADANAVDTTASFSGAGTYILRLSADDSDLQTNDDVMITVNPANDTTPPDKPTGLEIME